VVLAKIGEFLKQNKAAVGKNPKVNK